MGTLGRMSASDSIHGASLLALPPCGPQYWPQHVLSLHSLSVGDLYSEPLDTVRKSHEEPEGASLLAEAAHRMVSELAVMVLKKADRIVAGEAVYVSIVEVAHIPEVALESEQLLVLPK